MKRRKYALFAGLSALLALTVAFSGATVSGVGGEELLGGGERVAVLCLGFDDAAENTDVMILLTVDPSASSISFLQIPRDTYFQAETLQNKINQLYPYYYTRGDDNSKALAVVTRDVSAALGVDIDYYAAVDLASLASLFDAIGGVDVVVPHGLQVEHHDGDGYITIPAGGQHLSGDQAVAFLRYRSEYTEGDLGRVDAQKLLLASIYRKIKNDLSLVDIARVLTDGMQRIKTNMPLSRQISLAYAFYRDRALYSVRLATLPGEAVLSAGTWYYAVNRQASTALLTEYGYDAAFDPEGRLTDKNNEALYTIYEKASVTYTVYTDRTLDELEIKINER